MTRIVHISDLHFGAAPEGVVAALIASINGERPDLVAISGDLTLAARTREFAAARAFIDALDAPTLSVPGNHDISPYRLLQRMINPYARWRRFIGPETEPSWQDDTVAVLGLDTVRRAQAHLDWSRGGVSPRRLLRLERKLALVPVGLIRIVVAHHPLLPMTEGPVHALAGGAGRVMAALGQHGVALVLAGHLHRSAALQGGMPGMPIVLQGASAASYRLRGEPNGYNRIDVAPGAPPVMTRCVWDGAVWQVAQSGQAIPI